MAWGPPFFWLAAFLEALGALLGDHDVGRLRIAVGDALAVRGIQAIQNLHAIFQCLGDRKGAAQLRAFDPAPRGESKVYGPNWSSGERGIADCNDSIPNGARGSASPILLHWGYSETESLAVKPLALIGSARAETAGGW